MKNWKVVLTTGGETLAEEKILRDIFQSDALSALLFVIAMMLHNYIGNALEATNLYKHKNLTRVCQGVCLF